MKKVWEEVLEKELQNRDDSEDFETYFCLKKTKVFNS